MTDSRLAAGHKPHVLRRLLSRLFSPVMLAYALMGSVAVAGFITTFILARMSGPTVIGQYALAITTGNILVILCMQGLDRILVREVAGDLRVGSTGKARAAMRQLRDYAGLCTVFGTLLWTLLLFQTPLNDWIGGYWPAMMLLPIFVPICVYYRLSIGAIRGTNNPLKAQFIEAFPTLAFPVLLLPMWYFGYEPDAFLTTGLFILVQFVAGLIAYFLLEPIVRPWEARPSEVPDGLRKAGWALMWTQMLHLVTEWYILVQLSAHGSAAEAGAFRVAIQIITIFTVLIATSESFVSARIAGDFRAGRSDLAWATHRRMSLLMLGLSSPLLLLCIFAPHWLLGTAFGPEFTMGAQALMLMAIVQVLHVGRGPLGAMFNMAKRDDILLKLTIAATATGVLCAFFLIPRYGLMGAAITQALPLVIRSGIGLVIGRIYLPRPGREMEQ